MLQESRRESPSDVTDTDRGPSREAPKWLGRYRRRRIDAVIDYFGEVSKGERPRVLSTDGPFAETKE